jgi:uncharacterized protein YjiS (DUF1127 family)
MSAINFLLSAGKVFSEWRRRDRAYAELMALDDHSLADIGIHRSQIGGLIEGVNMPAPSARPTLFPNGEKLARRKMA